jgi:hypothetical protein
VLEAGENLFFEILKAANRINGEVASERGIFISTASQHKKILLYVVFAVDKFDTR